MEYFLHKGYFLYRQNHILLLYLQFLFHLSFYHLHSQFLKCHQPLMIDYLAKNCQVQVLVIREVH